MNALSTHFENHLTEMGELGWHSQYCAWAGESGVCYLEGGRCFSCLVLVQMAVRPVGTERCFGGVM